MASDKKPRKANKGKYTNPKTGEFRHTDGDRRRRGGPNVDQAIRDKKIRQSFTGGIPEDEPPTTAE
ncbi:MAG: hypothetical protein C0467_29960 [Planctomycetaceae bacterium]|nr:hypothetical protein [Planctomycetaceae bacterium]